MKGPNYDNDVIKHYVRRKGWIEPFVKIYRKVERDFSSKKRPERFKYLTFCAKNAIDVFLLEKEKILYRDPKTNRLVNVYFCEENDEDFIIIQSLIGSASQGFFGNFAKLLFGNYNSVETSDGNEEFVESEDVLKRKLIRLKESQKNLFETFPFDIINFDIYGNAFPESQDRYSEQCKMFSKLLELQRGGPDYEISKFLLYLTVFTPVDKKQINSKTSSEFKGILYNNLKYDFFKNKVKEKYRTDDINSLDFHIQYVLGFLKLVVIRESYKHGWNVKLIELYCYDRKFKHNDEPYKMSCYILEFIRDTRLDNTQQDFIGSIPTIVEADYQTELTNFLDKFPIHVPSESSIESDIHEDLKSTVKFREDYLKSIGLI